MSPQTINAYYDCTSNEIVFPAAILQEPFYMSSIDVLNNDKYFDIYKDCDELEINKSYILTC